MGAGVRSTSGCIHGLFAAVAQAEPDAVALESDEGLLSYGELDRVSAAVARDLARAGIGPEDRVAIHGRLGAEALAAMLGTLEAGAAFVPLDPGDAPERTRRALEIASPRALLLAGEDEPAHLPPGVPAIRVDLEAEGADPRRPVASVDERNLAYVIFTSGSTGSPKGVAVEHRAIVAYLESVADLYRIDGRWPPLPAITRFGFDASLLQTLGPILRGDPVWLLPPGIAEDPPALLERLERRPGAALHCVPTLWREMLAALEGGASPRLELGALLLGGETVPDDLWDRTRKLLPETRLADVYGPTETTVQVTGGYQGGGVPLTSARVHVLDERLEQVAEGAEGEICIGGPQVARCYLGDAAATAASFLPDPFGAPGSRLYRSGDRGAWNPDGTLRILGRRDRQVKIRGFRIELEEVEAALARHPEVAAAAAVAVALGEPQARIQAAVEARPGCRPAAAELREFAARFLPGHMIPAQLEVVPRLPRTGSGKLDRTGLFEAEPADAEAVPDGPAGDPVTAKVAAIWRDALGVEALAPDADFFALGGHSLLVTKVIGRTRGEFGVKVPLRTLFDNPQLAAFAGEVRSLLGEQGGQAESTIPRRREGAAPLSLQQLELHDGAETLRGTPFGNVLVPLRVAAEVAAADADAALGELAERHAILRSVFRSEGGAVVQVEAADPSPALARVEAVDGFAEAAATAARALYAEAPPLDEGPLLRAAFVDGGEERLLVLCLDHLTCDGVSVRILVDELSELLAARLQGRPPSRPAPDLQYADFAAWQRQRWSAGEYAPVVEYWREALSRAPAQADRPRSFRFDSARSSLPAAEWEQLKDLASGRGVTPFVALAAAIWDLRKPQGEALRMATMVAGRERAELERLIGPFANTVLLSLEGDGDPGAAARVERVRQRAVGAVANAALPMELVARHLDGGEESAPLEADVGFNLEPELDGPAGSGLLELVPASQAEAGPSLLPSGLPLNVIATPSRGQLELTVEYEEGEVRREEAATLAAGIGPRAKELLAQLPAR